MISYLKEKISHSTYIYWFEPSNKYVVVDKNFSDLLSLKLNETDNDKFINKIKDSFKLSEKNCNEIVYQMDEFISECTKSVNNKILKINKISKECKIHVEYTFNNKSLRVNFDSIQTKNLIHPKFLHLQTNKTQQISGRLTIFSVDGIIYLFNKDKCVGGWKFDNMHEFQGKFSMELTSFYYGKNEKDWMGVFHASAVTNDKNAIMLTGDSGSGKSSLTTILTVNGYGFVSDDFTPILSNDSFVYCFPSAISIKENFFSQANSMLKDFDKLESQYINDIKGWVKYLPPKFEKKHSFPCNNVIHVRYDSEGKNTLTEIDKSEAVKQFLPDAWIACNEKHAKKFIDWIIKTNFYSLHYSNNEKAINLIKKLK